MPPRVFKEIKIGRLSRMVLLKSEVFDVDAMEGLLRHEGISEMVKKDLRRYKKMRVNGNSVRIEYDYSKGLRDLKKGRVYPDPFVGLACFPHDVRAALSAKYYDDIDCENSQPVLLCQVARKQGVACEALEDYVAKRKEVLEAIQKTQKMTRDEAKQVCISVLFGGFRDEHPLLPRIKAELDALSLVIAGRFPEFMEAAKRSKDKKNNHTASALAHYIQNEERIILFALNAFLADRGYEMDVLIHDGGQVRRRNNEPFPTSLLEEAKGVVLEKTGYAITLCVKPLTHSFDFSTKSNTIMPQNILINDSFAAKKFVEIAGDKLRKCGGELYIQNDEGIWETGDDAIRGVIHQYEERLLWKQYNAIGMLNTFDYGGDVNKISKLIIQTQVWANPGQLPLQMTHLTTQSDGETRTEEVEMFLGLLKLVCGNNDQLTDYVMKWLAHTLQKPYELPGVMLILSGSKGVGKDTLFDFLIAHVFGKYSATNYTNNKQFFEKHDTGRKGMFFVKLEEADRKMCLENASDLKGMITGESITFNPKNQKAISVPNYTRYVFTTNRGNPVDFTADERRFVILPCSAEKKGDTTYWAEIRQRLFNDQVGKAVAEYLLAVNLGEFNVRQLPANEYQADVVEAELSPEQRFITSWNGELLAATSFYQLYRDYCVENDYRYAENQTRFGNLMLPFIRDGILQKVREKLGVFYKK